MKTILPLLLIFGFLPQNQTAVVSEDSPVALVSFKWFKDRQTPLYVDGSLPPAAAMIPQNKNFERYRRANASPGERDPNLDTIDGRSAALERAVQESRAPKPIDGYSYRAKIHNAAGKAVQIVFWEYQFKGATDPTPLVRRQFLCAVSVKPDKDKELQAFSLAGPQDVVSVATLSNKSTSPNEQVIINRVEFADGTIWQRKGWDFGDVRLGFQRAVATPWGGEMCRGL